MTELQIAIGHLKETISVGNVLLAKLESAQKDLEKPEVPIFPIRFIAVKDPQLAGQYIIGIEYPGLWSELPHGYKGRACFNRTDVRQIIKGLQTLLGESNG